MMKRWVERVAALLLPPLLLLLVCTSQPSSAKSASKDGGSATTVKSPDLETSWIHRVMDLVDDDNDGSITMEETQDVINKELLGFKHTADEFHQGDTERDEGELMSAWLLNPVRDWTTDQLVTWAKDLQLDSCVDGITRYRLKGKDLAHLAVSADTIFALCKSKEDAHRLKLRSLDAVLFGSTPTNLGLSYAITGVAVCVSLLLLAVVGYYDSKTKRLNGELKRVAKEVTAISDLEQKVEQYETSLSKDSGKAQRELKNMSKQSARAKDEADGLRSEVRHLKEQHKVMRTKLKDLLQQSYEQETQLLSLVKELTQKRKLLARREAEKLETQRRSVFGILRLANSVRPSQCETEMHSVLELYELLGQVAKERSERWGRLQKTVGFRLVMGSDSASSSLSPLLKRKGHHGHKQQHHDTSDNSTATTSTTSRGNGNGHHRHRHNHPHSNDADDSNSAAAATKGDTEQPAIFVTSASQ